MVGILYLVVVMVIYCLLVVNVGVCVKAVLGVMGVCWCFNLWFARYVLLLWLVWFALVVSGGCLVAAGYYTVACYGCGLWW